MAIYPVVDGRRARHAVAGFDLTFTVPKSASVLWAMADEPTRTLITRAHHLAVKDALAFLEQRVAATRVGHTGVQSMAVRGLVAAAFDHWDTRAVDPNLHTHLVIANKVQGVDGVWRSLDGGCTRQRLRCLSCTTTWSPTGSQPSSRSGGHIVTVAAAARRRSRWTAWTTACWPSSPYAPPRSRPGRASWPPRSGQSTGGPRPGWSAPGSPSEPAATPARPRPEAMQRLALDTVAGVQSRRTTWDEWNLHAEASRVTRSLRMSGRASGSASRI
jgi:hypothetical protein